MPDVRADIAIVGAGMAGASLAAAIGGRASVLLLEAESQPGYHATGRSAAFWTESYGGPGVLPLTTASGPWLAAAGVLRPRGCLHIARDQRALDRVAEELERGAIAHELLDRAALLERVPGLRPGYETGLFEPSCQDIDVAAVHARFLRDARQAGARILCDARLMAAERTGAGWALETSAGTVIASILVNAAGAWASRIGALAGALPVQIQPFRRTILQISTDPAAEADLPLVMDAEGGFYFKPEPGGRLWLSPHDESPVDAHDVAPEEIDQAIALDRFGQVVDWRIVRRERAWSGLRSFAPDRLPVYGYDPHVPDFFWCAGQGGFGIQTAPAAAMLAAVLLLREDAPEAVRSIDPLRFDPARFV